MITIDFTYCTVTPESAEHGDAFEEGFILPGMWKFSAENYDTRAAWKLGNLENFIAFAKSLGVCESDGADGYYSVDPDIDYALGAETTYHMHIGGASVPTVERIGRLLGVT